MMKNNLIIILAILTMFAACGTKEEWEGEIYKEHGVMVVENRDPGLWGEEAGDKVQFMEDFSIGKYEGEDYLMFVRYLSIVVDSELNLYLLDRGNHRLLKFSNKGNFIWQTGRKGQGPGEFQYPREISISPSGEIAVQDGSALHFYTMDGDFQRTLKLRGSFMNFTILPDGRILTTKMMRGQLGLSAEYHSKEGQFLKKFPDEYRYGPKFSFGGGAWYGGEFKLYDNKIYLSLPGHYEIREYDLEGKILGKIRRDLKIKQPEIEIKENSVTFHLSDVSGPCFFYKNEMMINLVNTVEKKDEKKYELKKFMDFFNQKKQFLGTYQLPENQTLAAIDSEGHFYFIQWEPYPKVIRSKLILF
ncbi:MAG: 6-bladed beta-propeller [Candidatus Aminicenantes bacterium]|nr:MAG: 6-bladed beta-propeller [Candidatus Aminicenantes bacterium]